MGAGCILDNKRKSRRYGDVMTGESRFYRSDIMCLFARTPSRLLWRLRHGSPYMVRIYRLTEPVPSPAGCVGQSTVVEYIARRRFKVHCYCLRSDPAVDEDSRGLALQDQSDMLNVFWRFNFGAVASLAASGWKDSTESIDRALEAARSHRLELLERSRQARAELTTPGPLPRRGLRGYVRITETPPLSEEATGRLLARQSQLLRRLARCSSVIWRPIDPTPEGHGCEVLEADGRTEIAIP